MVVARQLAVLLHGPLLSDLETNPPARFGGNRSAPHSNRRMLLVAPVAQERLGKGVVVMTGKEDVHLDPPLGSLSTADWRAGSAGGSRTPSMDPFDSVIRFLGFAASCWSSKRSDGLVARLDHRGSLGNKARASLKIVWLPMTRVSGRGDGRDFRWRCWIRRIRPGSHSKPCHGRAIEGASEALSG